MIFTNFIEEINLLEVKYEGIISVEELIEYINETRSNESYPRDLRIITDARNVKMDFNPNDLNKIVEANTKSLKKYNSITDAFVIDKPKETALSLLFQELSKNKKYKFNIFFNLDNAINWIFQTKDILITAN